MILKRDVDQKRGAACANITSLRALGLRRVSIASLEKRGINRSSRHTRLMRLIIRKNMGKPRDICSKTLSDILCIDQTKTGCFYSNSEFYIK